jgi:hypothetical protein
MNMRFCLEPAEAVRRASKTHLAQTRVDSAGVRAVQCESPDTEPYLT